MGKQDGEKTGSLFANPMGIASDHNGNLYVADSYNNQIRKIDQAGIVTTLAGNENAGSVDGKGIKASFFYPSALTVDLKGNIYVTDMHNNLIRKISTDGIVTTLAGRTEKNEDYGGKFPMFDYPMGIAIDNSGNIMVADSYHNKIRKITPNGKISIFAGSGQPGISDGQGAKAGFYIPEGLVFDKKGNLYVADTFNNMIRKIDQNGFVSTFAGKKAKGKKDGKGKNALFLHPTNLAIDTNDNIYVTDSGNNIIRKITPNGQVSTLAGSGMRGSTDGKLLTATFFKPTGITLTNNHSLYISDFDNNTIRKISF